MHTALNEFDYQLKDGLVWRFRANQTAYMQLEKLSGLPLALALSPAPIIDSETGEEHPPQKAQLLILYAMTASYRAQEAKRMRFTFDEERDPKDGFRGPFFTDIVPTQLLKKLITDATLAIRADFGFAEVYSEGDAESLEEGAEGN